MKRKLLFAGAFAVAAMFAAGCSSNALDEELLTPGTPDVEEPVIPDGPATEEMRLEAPGQVIVAEDPDTRTTLSGNNVYWQVGDQATVFPGNGVTGRIFEAQNGSASTTTFLGQVSAAELAATSFVYTYPANAAVKRTSGTSNQLQGITIPATQGLVANSFGRGAAVSVGQGSSSLNFKNITGLVKIPIKASGAAISITAISVTGPNVLCGTGNVDAAVANPVLTSISDGSATVTLSGSAVSVAKDATTTFYAAVNPVNDPGTYTITVKTSDNKSFTTAVSGAGVARAKITALPTVTVSSSALTASIHYGMYNSYLRTANGAFDIDITARSYDPVTCKTIGTTTGTAVKDAIVYWRENTLTVGTLTVSGNKVAVSNLSGTGNALIAIRDASGNVLWSYHVWKPNDSATALINYVSDKGEKAYKVMPMALGATTKQGAGSAGLYYQWGRKDPLGRVSDITSGSSWIAMTAGTGGKLPSSAAVSQASAGSTNGAVLLYSVKNPATFIYYSSSTTYDWMPSKYNSLWGNAAGYSYPESTYKSVFDPCPQGYKVAPKELWRIFTKYTGNTSTAANFNVSGSFANGWTFYVASTNKTGATDFYPASGCRNSNSGGLTNVGTGGYAWSSSPNSASSVYGSNLNFSSSLVNPEGGNYRAYGFPVRCVQE